jgi:hypothetical protein
MANDGLFDKNDIEKQASSENLSDKAQPTSYGHDEQMRRGSVTSYHEGQ